jgi:hypothetical protein
MATAKQIAARRKNAMKAHISRIGMTNRRNPILSAMRKAKGRGRTRANIRVRR